jgi:AraC-like DNA-binding protein
MAQPIRLFVGRFGRLQLLELTAEEAPLDGAAPQVLAKIDGADVPWRIGDSGVELTRENLLFANSGERSQPLPRLERIPTQVLCFELSAACLGEHFPAAAGRATRPFAASSERVTPRIRQLLDTLAVETLNDQFLSQERLEFILLELLLAVGETYLARRRTGARFWRGSPFADSRIRRALNLLRARPSKLLNMDELASQVGLSRSRFYDLFHTSTGRSPGSYLDLLCVESAIAKLSSGQAKIAEVSAELGFSAQSNFTRFFQNQVGIPPSEYRAAMRRPPDAEAQE